MYFHFVVAIWEEKKIEEKEMIWFHELYGNWLGKLMQ